MSECAGKYFKCMRKSIRVIQQEVQELDFTGRFQDFPIAHDFLDQDSQVSPMQATRSSSRAYYIFNHCDIVFYQFIVILFILIFIWLHMKYNKIIGYSINGRRKFSLN